MFKPLHPFSKLEIFMGFASDYRDKLCDKLCSPQIGTEHV